MASCKNTIIQYGQYTIQNILLGIPCSDMHALSSSGGLNNLTIVFSTV